MALLALSVLPMVSPVSIGSGVGVDIQTEDFAPLVWMCDSRVVYDDNTEPGRITLGGSPLFERINNYAFEGEQIAWTVLVMDKNKIDQNIDVYATIGDVQGEGNDIEVNCVRTSHSEQNFRSCNARIQEELVQWDENLMDFFECTLTVETSESMHDEFWVTVEALDGDGLMGTMDENELWFFNPEIALSIDGDLVFEDVRPGTQSYSDTISIGNEAEDGSGVLLDMFISGTDFYDSSSSGARCPTTNQLALTNFNYFATSGAYSSLIDPRPDNDGIGTNDGEGYTGIGYGIGFNNPNTFYDVYEILQTPVTLPGGYYVGNLLTPGAEMSLTFRLSLPAPCNGDFDSGQIFFWGEAI